MVVDANSDGASEGEVRSVSQHGPGSQLFDSGDNTGHRVVEVLVACRLLDAAEALEEVLSVVTPLAKVKNIAIDNQVPAGMSIRGDRTRFKQVLYNLLSNAVKFTPENGRVWIADASREDAAGFCVGDTGIGIPESELEAVFDEFHQVGRPAGYRAQAQGWDWPSPAVWWNCMAVPSA